MIEGIEDSFGTWQETLEAIEAIVTEYFSSIFTTSYPTEIEQVTNIVQPMVFEHMNYLLGRDFQALEVQQALKQMHPTTTPGPNGMPPLFYQKFWSLSAVCVTQAVLDFLNHGVAPLDFNETHTVLIPKVKIPRRLLSIDL